MRVKLLREDVIHVALRRYLKSKGWQLIAGEYPNGTDDELVPLNIVDPVLACDQSPQPRQHSLGKLVPDLIAHKNGILLVIEAKPKYVSEDEAKLCNLLDVRRGDLCLAWTAFIERRRIPLCVDLSMFTVVPCLAFSGGASYIKREDFCYFLVYDINTIVADVSQTGVTID